MQATRIVSASRGYYTVVNKSCVSECIQTLRKADEKYITTLCRKGDRVPADGGSFGSHAVYGNGRGAGGGGDNEAGLTRKKGGGVQEQEEEEGGRRAEARGGMWSGESECVGKG